MTNVKSIGYFRAFGENNNGNWVARVRTADGAEFFAGVDSGYNLAQIQALISNNRVSVGQEFSNEEMLHPFTRESTGKIFKALPIGVEIKSK